MILVTGGAGFIGSNVVAALCERGMPVTICDRLRDSGKWRNIAKSDVRDIVAPEMLEGWLERKPRLLGVVHMGAVSSTTARDADLVFDVNVGLSTRLWHWCCTNEVPFIYASSAASYGAGERGFTDDATPEALARLKPLSAYGWSKLFFDRRIARSIASGEPKPPQWAGLRFFNVFGPNEYHKGPMQSVVAQKYPLVEQQRPVTLFRSYDPAYADGEQLRDFVYVDDCVAIILWLLENTHVSGLFNVGTGQARSFSDIVRAMADALGMGTQIEFIDMPEAIRPNYQYFTEADIGRLRAAGYDRPFYSLENGVGEYLMRYLTTDDQYR
jgi:ADP-L-glycero-D-manno-heptose 6-epimerase